MRNLTGKCVSNQIVIAPLLFVKKAAVVSDLMEETAEEACERFKAAREKAVSFCRELIRKAEEEQNPEAGAIFEAQELLVTDFVFEEAVLQKIREAHLTPAMAVVSAGEELKASLSVLEDERISDKTADVDDVVTYYLKALGACETTGDAEMSHKVIVMAEELTPADTMRLPREYVAGFVTRAGSAVSHVSILAGSLSVPALYGVDVSEEYDGKLAILDGGTNLLIVEPDEETMQLYRCKEDAQKNLNKKGLHNPKETVWKCYANVSSAEEAGKAFANGAEGIGLYRSECLFMGREQMPTEEEQFEVYRNLLECAQGREVVIRILDIGSDKRCPCLSMEEERNPALGVRGIRYLFANPSVLETQLRALKRACAYGKLSILFPMITTPEEVRMAKAYCGELPSEVRIGMMIETPAAALITDLIAGECDFISIGTNDLLQYLMAADRDSVLADAYLTPEHPAVNRLLEKIVSDAHAQGCEVCICGELAGNKQMEPFFEKWNVDVLSVAWNRRT